MCHIRISCLMCLKLRVTKVDLKPINYLGIHSFINVVQELY
jgi:hypothetical protein